MKDLILTILTLIAVIAGMIFIAFLCAKASNQAKTNHPQVKKRRTVRCPTCGAQAAVHGRAWDCGFCGDCGSVK